MSLPSEDAVDETDNDLHGNVVGVLATQRTQEGAHGLNDGNDERAEADRAERRRQRAAGRLECRIVRHVVVLSSHKVPLRGKTIDQR
jgi:hypothetical protein